MNTMTLYLKVAWLDINFFVYSVCCSSCAEDSRTEKNYSNRTFGCGEILCSSGTKPTTLATTFLLFELFSLSPVANMAAN